MNLQAERLSALIEFCHQSARLRRDTSVAAVSSHSNFSLYEHDLAGAPGVRLNFGRLDSTDEIWLSVERLHETRPPEVNGDYLSPWLILAKGPNEEPSLKQSVDGKALIEAGTHAEEESDLLLHIASDALINFNDYSERHRVSALLEEYTKTK